MTRTELKAFVEHLATERGIDFRHDELQGGSLPQYQRTPKAPAGGLGNYVHVRLTRGIPDLDAIVQFITDEPGHAHYRLPFRALGDDVLEWGFVAMS